MQENRSRRLVLVGGGHSHAIALREWIKHPIPQLDLILISERPNTPYSGMLPGYVAGFYDYQQTHINLERLARASQAQWHLDRVVGLDLQKNQIFCTNHPPLSFDYLSIDIGSTPSINNVPGAADYAIPAKPVAPFLAEWHSLMAQVQQNPECPLTLCVVGGGAGGVELILNMQARLDNILRNQGKSNECLQFHLVHRHPYLLSHSYPSISRQLEQILRNRQIKVHLSELVVNIQTQGSHFYTIHCQSGLTLPANRIIWVTQGAAASWVGESGLATDDRGFILINSYLQSLSHSQVFATGDIATLPEYPRPKAGVFAVRQGKPLAHNLRCMSANQPLKAYIPQKRHLNLIGTGDRNAIAIWGNLGLYAPYLWSWKDYIDRKFMRQFE